MEYRVETGLYAIGSPGPDSPVLVSANYKMSFDRLRSQMSGLDVWILVLDTQGVNVWCAAGKGTLSTDELVRRIEEYRLVERTSHRTVIVPQLAAPVWLPTRSGSKRGCRWCMAPSVPRICPPFWTRG